MNYKHLRNWALYVPLMAVLNAFNVTATGDTLKSPKGLEQLVEREVHPKEVTNINYNIPMEPYHSNHTNNNGKSYTPKNPPTIDSGVELYPLNPQGMWVLIEYKNGLNPEPLEAGIEKLWCGQCQKVETPKGAVYTPRSYNPFNSSITLGKNEIKFENVPLGFVMEFITEQFIKGGFRFPEEVKKTLEPLRELYKRGL